MQGEGRALHGCKRKLWAGNTDRGTTVCTTGKVRMDWGAISHVRVIADAAARRTGEAPDREVPVILSLADYGVVVIDSTRHQNTVAAATADKQASIEACELTRCLSLPLNRSQGRDYDWS